MKRAVGLALVLALAAGMPAATAGAVVTASAGLGSISDRSAGPMRRGAPGDLRALRPPIVWDPIPFGARRRKQMAGYSKRHYGEWTWRLSDPQVIVEHYTDGTTWQGAWSWFASNTKHNGERPGTCAHFLIDTDGTIRQLVRLNVRCRHAVGMNHTAIGIEHVGTSDAMVLHNDRQMRSSLRLTRWLMARFEISIGNVIGHRETLESPLRFELDPAWRCLVHADFPHRAMRAYRARLRAFLVRRGVPAGPGPHWVDPGC